jgi:hypothetical protein
MGQYIKHNGESFKLGTCESCYYTTYQNMLAENQKGTLTDDGDGNAETYLKANSGYRFRFPFPDEDHVKFGEYPEDFDRGVFIKLLRDRLTDGWGKDYEDVTAWHNLNDDKELRVKLTGKNPNNFEDFIKLEIVQQKSVDGLLWVVLRDPFTRNMFRVEPADVVELVNSIICSYINPDTRFSHVENPGFYDEICSRIMAGYLLPYEYHLDQLKAV